MHNETLKIKAATIQAGYDARMAHAWESDNPYRDGTDLAFWWDHGFLMADSDLDAHVRKGLQHDNF